MKDNESVKLISSTPHPEQLPNEDQLPISIASCALLEVSTHLVTNSILAGSSQDEPSPPVHYSAEETKVGSDYRNR